MVIKGTIDGKVEIKSSGQEFHDVYNGKPHHLANITPEKVHGCTLHSGDLGCAGSIIEWHYTHDGEMRTNKCLVEVDDGTHMVVYNILEGSHLREAYTTFKATYVVIPKPDNGGSIVHWIIEYEKTEESTPEPTSFLEFLLRVSGEVDAHIQEEADAANK